MLCVAVCIVFQTISAANICAGCPSTPIPLAGQKPRQKPMRAPHKFQKKAKKERVVTLRPTGPVVDGDEVTIGKRGGLVRSNS